MRTYVAVAVGLAVAAAVGCGPTVGGSASAPADSGKAADPGKSVADKGKEEAAKLAKELTDKLGAVKTNAEKELTAFDVALKNLDAKIKEESGDVAKLTPLNRLRDQANVLLADLRKKVTDLAGSKDLASLHAAEAEITKVVDELKGKLKDYLPK